MRLVVLVLPLALAGCNANRANNQLAPELTLPPPPTSIRVAPPGEKSPDGQNCAADIARFRAAQTEDLAKNLLAQRVYDEIQSEIAEADQACGQGDNLRAEGLLRASKVKHGYSG